jgi:hypothetical protein
MRHQQEAMVRQRERVEECRRLEEAEHRRQYEEFEQCCIPGFSLPWPMPHADQQTDQGDAGKWWD